MIPTAHDVLVRVIGRIECPAARKAVIMAKRERGVITPAQADRLIEECVG